MHFEASRRRYRRLFIVPVAFLILFPPLVFGAFESLSACLLPGMRAWAHLAAPVSILLAAAYSALEFRLWLVEVREAGSMAFDLEKEFFLANGEPFFWAQVNEAELLGERDRFGNRRTYLAMDFTGERRFRSVRMFDVSAMDGPDIRAIICKINRCSVEVRTIIKERGRVDRPLT